MYIMATIAAPSVEHIYYIRFSCVDNFLCLYPAGVDSYPAFLIWHSGLTALQALIDYYTPLHITLIIIDSNYSDSFSTVIFTMKGYSYPSG
jgi:hypothetical protein